VCVCVNFQQENVEKFTKAEIFETELRTAVYGYHLSSANFQEPFVGTDELQTRCLNGEAQFEILKSLLMCSCVGKE